MSVFFYTQAAAQTPPTPTPQSTRQPIPLPTAPIAGEPVLPQAKQVYELHAVHFVIQSDSGETADINENDLTGVVVSKPSNPGVSNRILHYFDKELTRNSITPRFIRVAVRRLAKTADSIENETRSFDRTVANYDAFRLQDYFLQIGYHDARVRYNFHISADRENNVLTFFIHSGKRYMVDTVTYHGIDTLPPDIRVKLNAVADSMKGNPFTESVIRYQLAKMIQVLRNNGYAKANVPKILVRNSNPRNEKDSVRWVNQTPVVMSDTTRKLDSISVFLAPDRRYRMGNVRFVDSLNGQPMVTDDIKQRQIEYNIGDWYDQSSIDRSVSNLLALGTFDRVAIDTISNTAQDTVLDKVGDTSTTPRTLRSLSPMPDTMHTTVFSQYRQAWDLTIAGGPWRSLLNGFLNLGAEASYLHRNLTNHADIMNLYLRTSIQDIVTWWNKIPKKPFAESWGPAWESVIYEYEVGGSYTRQDLFRLFERKVNLTIQLNGKQQIIADPFTMKSGDVRFTFAIPLPAYTFVNRIVFDFSMSIARTDGYSQAKAKDTNKNIAEQLALYDVLNKRADGGFRIISSILSLSVSGDRRDNLFAPRSGYTINAGIDGGIPGILGIANYLRIQFSASSFLPSGALSAWAGKIRLGHIFWRDVGNSYVPFDRHFFTGGANSVRSYPPQLLRDLQSGGTPGETGNLERYIGVASMVELSAEYRYSFRNYPSLGEFLSDKVKNMGITMFTDIGNGFNRLTKESYGKASLSDVFTPWKYAWGIGAGFRYMLPVGPFRIDLGMRLYDPTQPDIGQRWIFKRTQVFTAKFYDNFYPSISLGHAF